MPQILAPNLFTDLLQVKSEQLPTRSTTRSTASRLTWSEHVQLTDEIISNRLMPSPQHTSSRKFRPISHSRKVPELFRSTTTTPATKPRKTFSSIKQLENKALQMKTYKEPKTIIENTFEQKQTAARKNLFKLTSTKEYNLFIAQKKYFYQQSQIQQQLIGEFERGNKIRNSKSKINLDAVSQEQRAKLRDMFNIYDQII
ncbi:Hypothetical_protein [Hexamita inflata]|uniref:Hypothetical_protein n=1 Tax=Hexamita inflata TaxID=28002 RepID=A0AA86RK64_9EUKA|nr:Hypothetical protein HINF_LOCUS62783 [Hexamita inflata]